MKRTESMSEKLIAQDLLLTSQEYARYRRSLQDALTKAEHRERRAYRICLVSGVISFSLMFVGGSQMFGSFDPWDSTATPAFVALGIVYLGTSILFWVLLASYYSRFRPNTRRAQDALRDEKISHLERSVAELRELILAFRAMGPSEINRVNENKSDSD